MINIVDKYYEWIFKIVSDKKYTKGLPYNKLLHQLFNIDFTFSIPMDGNRYEDGIDLRYRFAEEERLSKHIVADQLDIRPCTVLEMMVALALRMEEGIMDNPEYGNRTGLWFWEMISNLGLARMTDDHYDREYVFEVIYDFMDRNYQHDGEGGLFTVRNPRQDMRTVDIWYQAMWYLDTYNS